MTIYCFHLTSSTSALSLRTLYMQFIYSIGGLFWYEVGTLMYCCALWALFFVILNDLIVFFHIIILVFAVFISGLFIIVQCGIILSFTFACIFRCCNCYDNVCGCWLLYNMVVGHRIITFVFCWCCAFGFDISHSLSQLVWYCECFTKILTICHHSC